MAHTLLVNGTTFTSVDASFPGGSAAAGNYWALPPLGLEPCYTGKKYSDALLAVVGERTGIMLKRKNYAPRMVYADLVIVNTVAGARGAVETLINGFVENNGEPIRYSITLPDGNEIPGCSWLGVGRYASKNLNNGMIAYVLPCTWQQLSDSN